MQIASNCPQLDHLYNDADQEIICIVEEAFLHWENLIKRFLGRSNGKAGRKAKAKSKPLADVFEQQVRTPEKLFTMLGC